MIHLPYRKKLHQHKTLVLDALEKLADFYLNKSNIMKIFKDSTNHERCFALYLDPSIHHQHMIW